MACASPREGLEPLLQYCTLVLLHDEGKLA